MSDASAKIGGVDRDRALDKAADAWARAQGARLPSETDTARLLGGNHERRDRGPPAEHLARLHRRRLEALGMRHYLDIIEARLRAIYAAQRAMTSERARLETHRVVLSMRLQGDGAELPEIAAALGYKSHTSAGDLLEEIRVEAAARYVQRGSVAVPCRCGTPGCVVIGHAGTGRPRLYKPGCDRLADNARRAARRRVSRTDDRRGEK